MKGLTRKNPEYFQDHEIVWNIFYKICSYMSEYILEISSTTYIMVKKQL